MRAGMCPALIFFDRDGIERDDIFRKNYYVKQLLVKQLLVKQLLHKQLLRIFELSIDRSVFWSQICFFM